MSSAWEETYILSPLMGDEGKTGSFFCLCLSLWPPHTGFLLLLHWDFLCYYQVKQLCLNAKMYTVCSLVYNGLTVSPFVCLGHKQHSWKKMPQNLPHWPFLSKTWKPLLMKLKQIRQEEKEERSWSNNSHFGCISISVLWELSNPWCAFWAKSLLWLLFLNEHHGSSWEGMWFLCSTHCQQLQASTMGLDNPLHIVIFAACLGGFAASTCFNLSCSYPFF